MEGSVVMYYRDITWCCSKCDNKDCSRKLKPYDEERIKKEHWLVAMADYRSQCESYITPERKQNERV